MEHDTRDLDGVIDEVAQAMTGAELRRDLRPAVAARVAGRRPGWTLDWRVATAATAIASVVFAVVVMRPGGEPETPPPARVAAVEQTPRVEPSQPVPAVVEARAVPRARRAFVARQRLGGITTADVVEIDPLAIVPLDADEAGSSQQVEIVPIEVEPVRISQLEPIAE